MPCAIVVVVKHREGFCFYKLSEVWDKGAGRVKDVKDTFVKTGSFSL